MEMDVSGVREIGFVDAPIEEGDDFIGVSTTLLEGEWHGATVRGLQVGAYLMWFLPDEAQQIGAFLAGAQ